MAEPEEMEDGECSDTSSSSSDDDDDDVKSNASTSTATDDGNFYKADLCDGYLFQIGSTQYAGKV